MKARGPASVVRQTHFSAPEVERLVEDLWRELGELYPEMRGTKFAEISGRGSGFVVAWLENEPVGCGAWRPFAPNEPDIAEIKRMFVRLPNRGCGISRMILGKLEKCARADGYILVRLETGLRQPGAIRLYETSGYQRIEPFGCYRDDPLSVCFEKVL